MKTPTLASEHQQLLATVIQQLSQDSLCLEIRHYPAVVATANGDTLHLLVITQRELTQAERRDYMATLHRLAEQHNTKIDVLFSSPKVWRDLKKLVSPFTHIDRTAVIDWQRDN